MSERNYYVPDQSKLPILTGFGLGVTAFGAGYWALGHSPVFFLAGALLLAVVLYSWFGQVIGENLEGLNNDQVKRSYVWGMGWFIFSEVMFFAAFFGALFYVRMWAVPWLGGEGIGDSTNAMLWQGFEPAWPMMTTPDMAAGGETFIGPEQHMGFLGWDKLFSWLPLWNTVILLSSSVTVHFAHAALKKDRRSQFQLWLGITVLLGIIFLAVQYEEYHEAYSAMGLTLASGIYGTTFFMLTGFHGAHVTLGTFMLLLQWLRGFKGHFRSGDQFGFEATSWYWHFVDVVWVGLFLFVYVLAS